NKIIVFNNGNSVGFIDVIPTGGHVAPISIVGPIAEWKYAQNNDTKINTSDPTNNKNPKFNPLLTAINIVANTTDAANANHHNDPIYPCIVKAKVNINDNIENDIIIGHGDGATK
ncbi:hypothetical protein C6P40_002659, partial [Pichia californica]